MTQKKEELMLAGYKPLKQAREGFKNEWHVQCGGEDFVLSQDQAELLKRATVLGERGLVWFDDFAISIPHIQSILRKPVRSY